MQNAGASATCKGRWMARQVHGARDHARREAQLKRAIPLRIQTESDPPA